MCERPLSAVLPRRARQSCNPVPFSLLHTLSRRITSDTKEGPLETPRFPILLLSNCSSSSRLGHPQNRPGSPPGLFPLEIGMRYKREALPTALGWAVFALIVLGSAFYALGCLHDAVLPFLQVAGPFQSNENMIP